MDPQISKYEIVRTADGSKKMLPFCSAGKISWLSLRLTAAIMTLGFLDLAELMVANLLTALWRDLHVSSFIKREEQTTYVDEALPWMSRRTLIQVVDMKYYRSWIWRRWRLIYLKSAWLLTFDFWIGHRRRSHT